MEYNTVKLWQFKPAIHKLFVEQLYFNITPYHLDFILSKSSPI